MRKDEQKKINDLVLNFLNEVNSHNENEWSVERLRSCSAVVISTKSYYLLKSYNTIIAGIDKETDTLYDFLRYVYGYTATSAQHISKFEKDYCQGKWNCAHRYTYRPI